MWDFGFRPKRLPKSSIRNPKLRMSDLPFTQHSFQSYLDAGKLMGSRCVATGELFVPPRALCPTTLSDEMVWEALSGDARLVAYTVVNIGPSAMIDAGYDRKNPYCTGIVELAEGPRMSAQIIGVDTTQPESIEIGMPLRVTFLNRGDSEVRFLGFSPA